MLKQKMEQYISETLHENKLELFKEEKEYAERHQLTNGFTLIEKANSARFTDVYIERNFKENEELITKESVAFLSQPLDYLKIHKQEFLYFESAWFELIGLETLTLEVDDVFGTYHAMFGLKLPKKLGNVLKAYFKKELEGEIGSYSVMFNQDDGLWDVNFSLNSVEGFKEEMTIGDALSLIYHFLFILIATLEDL